MTLAAAVAVAIGGPYSRSAAHNRESQVTWTADIEPIIKRRCVGCHTANGFAPMSLATYQEARANATTIRREVLERRMPPWPAAPAFGEFLNSRSLTPIEVELIAAWAAGATPLGPSFPAYESTAAVTARSPDLVLRMPLRRDVPSTLERIEVPAGAGEDRWITGWEFRPGNASIVDRAVITILPDGFVGAWSPPEGAILYPAGVGQRLPAGARLAIDVHYRKSASPQADQSSIALYFGPRPRYPLRHGTLTCGATPIDREIEALAIAPHAAAAGASVEIVGRHPDGRVTPLAAVPRYEPAYPITYRFRSGVRVSRGSTLEVNSSAADCQADLEYIQRETR